MFRYILFSYLVVQHLEHSLIDRIYVQGTCSILVFVRTYIAFRVILSNLPLNFVVISLNVMKTILFMKLRGIDPHFIAISSFPFLFYDSLSMYSILTVFVHVMRG